MLVFVLEDDKRGIEIAKQFLNEGYFVSDNIKDIKYAKMIYLGMKGINYQHRVTHQNRICYLDEELFKNLSPDCFVFTIAESEVLRELSLKYSFHYICLMEDENFLKINTILTSEGLISYMIDKIKKPLYHSKIMILGYGHCGKSIAKRLLSFEADIKIAMRNLESKQDLEKDKYQFQSIENLSFEGIDIVINTIPSLIIDKNILKKIDKNTVLFDIASFPYGIDHHEALKMGFDSYIVSAIPSLYYSKFCSLCIMNLMKAKGDKNA